MLAVWCENGSLDMVKVLLAKGGGAIDLAIRSVEGKTALDFARARELKEVVECLIEASTAAAAGGGKKGVGVGCGKALAVEGGGVDAPTGAGETEG